MEDETMATIYISYQHLDEKFATELAHELGDLGHTVRYDKELYIGAAWRDHLMQALLASDCVVVLWGPNTLGSHFVHAEVGAVRATPRIGLLPVILEEVAIPFFLQDLFAESYPSEHVTTMAQLAARLNHAVQKHIAHRQRRKLGRPRIFISHRHKDEEIVRALVKCIEAYFQVSREDIRCTSVWPYRLPVGENTAERLRIEIADAEVVLGILGTDTLQSSYVAFELGSAWGQRVWTCPLLTRGAKQGHIPDPIRDLSPLFLTDAEECRQLLQHMELITTLERRGTVDEAALTAAITALVQAAQPLAEPACRTAGPTARRARVRSGG
jgi:hypothetical protein